MGCFFLINRCFGHHQDFNFPQTYSPEAILDTMEDHFTDHFHKKTDTTGLAFAIC